MRHLRVRGTAWFEMVTAATMLVVLCSLDRSAPERSTAPAPAAASPPSAPTGLSLALSEHVVLIGPEWIELDGDIVASVASTQSWDAPRFKIDSLFERLAAFPGRHEVLLLIRRGPTQGYEDVLKAVVSNSASAAGYLPMLLDEPRAIELDLEGDTLRCNGVEIDAVRLVSTLDAARATSTQQVPLVILHAEAGDWRIAAYRLAIRLAGYVPVVITAAARAPAAHVLTVDDHGVLFDGERTTTYSTFCQAIGGHDGCDSIPGSKGLLIVVPLDDVDRRRPDLMADVDHQARLAGFVPRVEHPVNLPQLVVNDGVTLDGQPFTIPLR